MKQALGKQKRLVVQFREPTTPSPVAQLLDPFQYMASANYVVPMLVALAIARSNDIVDHLPRYSSLDHATNWSVLLACIGRFDGFTLPYFESPLVADPFAEELLSYEHRKIWRRHVVASFEQEMWSLVDDGSGLRIRLAEPMRRSALHLVADKARYLRAPDAVRQLLTDPQPDSASLALCSGTNELTMFAESCPEAWRRLKAELPFPVSALPGFRSFVLTLGGAWGRRWVHAEQLWHLWQDFAATSEIEPHTQSVFTALVDFHSLTVEEAQNWGTQAAFLRFGNTYLVWFFVFHVLLPDLNFLVLLARRYETLWSRTVGSELACVADWLGNRLPTPERLRWAARRRRTGVGEADLILRDTQTGHVLVLELKTVFDKFRTHLQMRNFTEQKVNFPKALQKAGEAARDRRRTLAAARHFWQRRSGRTSQRHSRRLDLVGHLQSDTWTSGAGTLLQF
jgi:Holliday junction resolvase-like predicted endonuclease